MFEELAWFILVIIVITVIAYRFSATKHLPPGPFPLPIIGNVHQMTSESRHVDLTAMEKQYGPVIRLFLGSQLAIVVSGQTTIKEVPVTKSAEFDFHVKSFLGQWENHRFCGLLAKVEASSKDCRLCTQNVHHQRAKAGFSYK